MNLAYIDTPLGLVAVMLIPRMLFTILVQTVVTDLKLRAVLACNVEKDKESQ